MAATTLLTITDWHGRTPLKISLGQSFWFDIQVGAVTKSFEFHASEVRLLRAAIDEWEIHHSPAVRKEGDPG